jgi:ABC-type uncharacterized transport system substrate-binding protein
MRRREFVSLLGGAVAWPLGARAQQRPHVIGVLALQPLPPIQRFVRKLREYGYVEGENLQLHARFAEGRDDRYPSLALDLVKLPVDVIVTWGTPAALAAKQATTTIPVVMGSRQCRHLARSGGNITGFAAQNVDLEGKRLELLKDLIPNLSRVGILANATNLAVGLQKMQPVAKELRVIVDVFEVRDSDEVDGALTILQRARPDAVLVAPDLLLLSKRAEIAAAMANSKLPAVYPFREYASVGGLLSTAPTLACCSSALLVTWTEY